MQWDPLGKNVNTYIIFVIIIRQYLYKYNILNTVACPSTDSYSQMAPRFQTSFPVVELFGLQGSVL